MFTLQGLRIPLQWPAALAASLSFLVSGLFIGWSSPMLPRLQQDSSHIRLSAGEASWLASVGMVTTVPPSLLAAWLVDVAGRRALLLGCAPAFLAAALWMRFAASFWELLAAVVVANAAIGFVLPVIPVYMVEIAEDRVRGMLVSLCTLMGGVGSLLMMSVASYLPYFTVIEFMMAWPVAFVAIFWWMPESPYFLVAKHRTEEAKVALMRLRGKRSEKDVAAELDAIRKAVDERTSQEISVADAFQALRRDAGARRAVAVTLTFTVLLAMNGSATIGVYSTQIFVTSGSSLDASVSAIVLMAVQVVFSVVATLLVDRAGRRPMLLFSFAGCAAAVAALGAYFYLAEYGDQQLVSSLYWLPLTTLLLYYISYDVGGNALLWVLTNELVPSAVRGLCNSAVSVLNSVLTFGVTKLFQVVGDSLGSFVPFWFFSLCGLLGLIFTWFFIPETKGRSLEDISAEMSAKAATTKQFAEEA